MIGDLFNALVVQPIFNLLVFIYALLPGHNFGLAIIIFTIVIRMLLWPILKKQLHHTKAMRKLQPDIKRLKKAAAGDRQKESAMLMELYKERGISPFGPLGVIIIQFIVLIGLYVGLSHVVKDPKALLDNSYGWIRHLDWMQTIGKDISKFDNTLFGVIDLTRPAINVKGGGIYWPALMLVLGSAAAQFFQSVQLMPKAKDSRGLRQILRDAATGKESDQTEVNEAIGRGMKWFIPGMIIIFTVKLASALSLYWMVGGIVAYIQQARILGKDEEEMEQIGNEANPKSKKKDLSKITEAEIVTKEIKEQKTPPTKKSKAAKKRRKK